MELDLAKLARIERAIAALEVRVERLSEVFMARADANQWVTINSAKVLLGEDGSVQGGAGGNLAGKAFPNAKGSSAKAAPASASSEGKTHASPHSKALPHFDNDFSDTGTLNARMKEGNRDITELPFPGDTKVGEVLNAANAADKDWMYEAIDKPMTPVPVADLVAMQPTVTEHTIDEYREQGDADSGKMLAVKSGGKYYIRNGTHRTIARMQKGEQAIDFHVFDLDAAQAAKAP